ncbi:MAG: Fe(3+) ABC transporter substrate-binding protein [Rickettsiales bacterium]|nr:Fe(3+) ABC transporter substrate-binding protein [Rickettsiales bacterium]
MRLILYTLFFFFNFHSLFSNEINLFTTRHYEADYDLYKNFEKETGIKVNVISGKSKPLEKRILEEDKDCIGDVFFLADAGRLVSAEEKGIFQKVNSKILKNKVPKHLRNDYWFGLTKRARIIYYNPKLVKDDEILGMNYEDLANQKWNGQIAIRQSNNVYNQSLVSSLIETNGIKKTKEWLKGFVNNFSRVPQGNDRAQILAVAAGEAKIAIANTYYYALMLSGKKGPEQKKAAQKVKPFFPNQNNRGTHINISGAGILKFSPNKNNAVKFLEFLISPSAQKHLSNNTFEFPILENIEVTELVKNIGVDFKQDNSINVSSYGKWQKEAFKLMKESGWN